MTKPTSTALLLALAAGVAMSAPAHAQAQQAAASGQQAATGPKLQLSKEAAKAIIDLQTAVTANDVANIPAKVAAAQAVAKTADDQYAIAQLRYRAAANAKDDAGKAAALEALIASGKIPPADVPAFTIELGNHYKAANQLDRAASTFERVIASDPGNLGALVNLAETRASQGRDGDAVKLIRRAIGASKAAGKTPEENWYKRAASLAYKSKLPETMDVALEWTAAYPSATSWHDTIGIYRELSQPNDAMLLDLFRLQRAAGAMSSEADFQKYASMAAAKGYPDEAKAVLEEGFAAGKIDRNAEAFKTIMAVVTNRAADNKAALAGAAAAGLKAPTASAALSKADLLYGAGQFAKAAEVYRAALGKSGADAGLINLRLGAALALQGDKPAAIAALSAVKGANAELAKLWLAYVEGRA